MKERNLLWEPISKLLDSLTWRRERWSDLSIWRRADTRKALADSQEMGFESSIASNFKNMQDILQLQRREYEECNCDCHYNPNVMHCFPCCGGQCKGCGKYYFNLNSHQELCTMFRLRSSINSKNKK